MIGYNPEGLSPTEKISLLVKDLASQFGVDDGLGGLDAKFKSSTPFVESILLRYFPERDYCSANICYTDDTAYRIGWQDGEIWDFSHSDLSQVEGRNLERTLPFTKGLLRSTYMSHRYFRPDQEMQGMLNLHDFVSEHFVGPEEELADVMLPIGKPADIMEEIRKRIIEIRESEVGQLLAIACKDIDPDDIDLETLYAPITAIVPARDLIVK